MLGGQGSRSYGMQGGCLRGEGPGGAGWYMPRRSLSHGTLVLQVQVYSTLQAPVCSLDFPQPWRPWQGEPDSSRRLSLEGGGTGLTWAPGKEGLNQW